jgi:hypothetical protein
MATLSVHADPHSLSKHEKGGYDAMAQRAPKVAEVMAM